jgi:DNA adenine methylase
MRDRYTKKTHGVQSAKAKPARAPFGYYGAKLRIAGKIIDTLPPHNAWVEAFCGSAAITLAKKPVPIEVINDIDGDVVNVFEQLRNNAAELCRVVALTPYAHHSLDEARQTNLKATPLERARRFLVRNMMTVNATAGCSHTGFSFSQSYAREGREARVNRWYNLPDRLTKVVERIRGIRVESRDARELVGMFANRPATLMYLDPPYFTKRDHRYVIDANDEEFHTQLLERCRGAKCMLLISAYETPLYDKMLRRSDGWVKKRIETHTRDTTGKDYDRTEILWVNRSFTTAKASGNVPVVLTQKERLQNKINPPRI